MQLNNILKFRDDCPIFTKVKSQKSKEIDKHYYFWNLIIFTNNNNNNNNKLELKENKRFKISMISKTKRI